MSVTQKNNNLDHVNQDINQMSDSSKEQLLIQLNTQVNNFGGTLPNPDILRKYDQLVPGVAEQYFADVFKEGKLRRKMI